VSSGAAPYRTPRRAVFASTLTAAVALGVAIPVVLAGGAWQVPGARTGPSPDAAPTPATASPAPTATPATAPPSRDLTSETTAVASATAPDNFDDAGTPTAYAADNILDGDASTAWRVKGDGDGVTIDLNWSGRSHITEVGLVPGYAKVDPASGTERFPLNRRIDEVRWRFEDGTVVPQQFEDDPRLQTIPVDVTAASVTIEITSTIAGHPDYDYTAISDVSVVGSG
jgi:hypothetical protein